MSKKKNNKKKQKLKKVKKKQTKKQNKKQKIKKGIATFANGTDLMSTRVQYAAAAATWFSSSARAVWHPFECAQWCQERLALCWSSPYNTTDETNKKDILLPRFLPLCGFCIHYAAVPPSSQKWPPARPLLTTGSFDERAEARAQ